MAISVDDYLIDISDTVDRRHYRTLPDVFAAAVAAFGDVPAVLGPGRPRTWTQWRAESRALAAGLRELGIGAGDVVALHLPNCWEFLVAHVAIAELGAVMLPLHMSYGERDLRTLVQRAQARLVILSDTKQLSLSDIASVDKVLTAEDIAALINTHQGVALPPVELNPDMPFLVMPSSGSTSERPKLCLHSHGALLSNAARVVLDGREPGTDVIISGSPFTHLFGLLSIHTCLLTGSTQALLPRWDVTAFHGLARRTNANVLFAVPAQLRDVAQALRTNQTGELRLREVRTGGAAVPGSLVADIRELTGAATVVQWGMSELGAGTVTRPDDPAEVAVRSIGRPLTGSSARVVDDDGHVCPDGQVGQLQYRGPHLFRGYLGDPERTAAAVSPDGWLTTGDLASSNPDGTLSYHGRDAEVINVGGLKFSASNVEELLSDLPQIAYAAVTARSDERLGQYPCLIVQLRPGATLDLTAVRAHLTDKGAADYTLPAEMVVVDAVPLTPTGKIARGRLAGLLISDAAHRPPATELRNRLATLPEAERIRTMLTLVREHLASLVPDAAGAADRAFRELGVDSLGAVRLALELAAATGLDVPTTVVFDHPSPTSLARYLADLAITEGQTGPSHPADASSGAASTTDDPVAITGMACRFSGGIRSPEDLWHLLADGRDTVGPFPTDRGWDLEALGQSHHGHPALSSTDHGHFLTEAAEFDAGFFGISPREALAMDPQQRLLLETGWEALERAGLDPAALRGHDVGVFVGQMASDYAPRVNEAPELFDGLLLTGNASSVASGRISYTLGLNGPSLTVDTACSSGLVALRMAVHALQRGECSLALVAGGTVMATPASFVDFSRQGALAPDGRVKAFATTADGTAWGEGVGMLVLERQSDAQRDGHPVLALIAGSAVNSDGESNGLTAPNGLAQQQVLRTALADAGLRADEIDVVEAHGTGTPLGDRIEAGALHSVYGVGRDAERPLWLGSAKSNIGHTQAASGIAGVIKIVMAMRHGELPRTLYADTPNPQLTEAGTVRLLTEPRPWRRSDRVRRAGVSAFGISGTNAHVILQEPPEAPVAARQAPDDDRIVPWVLSARSESALRESAARLLPVAESADLVEAGQALVTARTAFEHRAVVVTSSRADLLAGLRGIADGALSADAVAGRARSEVRTVFVFPGQGGQWPGMAAELLAESEVFAEALAACDAALAPYVDWSVAAVLRGETGQPSLALDEVAQTAQFAVMVALAELWSSAGVRPDAVVGHSQGEIAAAYVSGALSLQDAAMVVARRAAAVSELAGGRMVAVGLPSTKLDSYLTAHEGLLSLAVDNGPHATVVSGDAAAAAALVDELTGHGVRATTLAVDYASHSAQVERIKDRVLGSLDGLRPRTATVPFYSTVVPGPLDTGALTGRYWYENLRNPVEFQRTVRALLDADYTDFVEISPHPVLVQSILEIAESAGREVTAVGTLRRDEGGQRRFLLSAAQAYSNGLPVSWRSGPGIAEPGRLVELPTYPFQRRRYWLPIGLSTGTVREPVVTEPVTDRRPVPDSEAAMLTLVRDQVAVVLGHDDADAIAPDDGFTQLGTSSLVAVELRTRLAHALDLSLPATVVLDEGTSRALAGHLWRLLRDRDQSDMVGDNQPDPLDGDRPRLADGDRSDRPELPDTLDALYRQACRTGQGTIAIELISAAAALRPTFSAASAAEHAPDPVRLGAAEGKATLVCFPSLLPTSGPHEHTALADALRETHQVLSLPQPGFGDRQPLPRDVEALVTAHTIALGRHAGGRPLLLCGHSSGGLVAHAVASRLAELGRPVNGLILLDTYWPDHVLWTELLPRVLTSTAVTEQALASFGIGTDRLTAAGGYMRLFTAWRPAAVDTPTLFVRAGQPITELAATGSRGTPWRLPHTTVDVPADHFTMLSDHVRFVADAINKWQPDATIED